MASIVFFHAHPDDEALLTAGTMRALADAGHSVHLVVATRGEAGLATIPAAELANVRIKELQKTAALLKTSDVHWLGYADSGLDGNATGKIETFVNADLEIASNRLAEYCRSVTAEVLIGYDKNGGYGHPDHVKIHQVANRAAEILDVDIFLEATVDRTKLSRVMNKFAWLAKLKGAADVLEIRNRFSAPNEIGILVDISRYTSLKQAAMRTHASQHAGGDQLRTLQVLSALPRGIFHSLFKTEWFVIRWQKVPQNPVAELASQKTLNIRS